MFGCVMKLPLVSMHCQKWVLFHPQSLACVCEPQNSNALHHTRGRVAKELAPRLQCAVDPDVMLGSHEEVARLGRVVRRLLGDVVTLRAVWVVPVASEDLTEDGIEWLLDASAILSVTVLALYSVFWGRIRRLDVPATQVELGHSDKALNRVLDVGQGKECLGVGHEAGGLSALLHQRVHRKTCLTL